MKLFTFLAVMCATAGLSAAETNLWDGAATSRTDKITTITAKDGVLTLTGKSSATERYSYIGCKINIAPTVFKGKKLSFTVSPASAFKGDTIYIKGMGANGSMPFSYWAHGLPAKKATYTLTIGENSGPFKWIPTQVKGPADAPVIAIQLFMGRADKNSDMKVEFSDFKLID